MKHKTAALLVLIVAALTLSATASAKPHGTKATKAANKVTICHMPGAHQETKEVPTSAVDGHLGHGDYSGACNPWTPPVLDTDGDGVADAADNCPLVANPGQQDSDEDGIGNACDSTPNGDEDEEEDEGNNDTKVVVCHNGSALDVNENAVGGHLGHGDTLGDCSVTPPVTPLVVTPPAAPKAPVGGNSAPVLPKGIQHAIYCDPAGKALNLIFGQPITDPAYQGKGLVLAVWLKGVGAVCDAKGAAFTGQYTSGNFYGGKLEMMPAWTYTAGAGGLIYLAYPLVGA